MITGRSTVHRSPGHRMVHSGARGRWACADRIGRVEVSGRVPGKGHTTMSDRDMRVMRHDEDPAGTVLGGGRWQVVEPEAGAVVIPLREPAMVDRRRGRRWSRGPSDAGMATAEYAVVLLAAVGFAGLLIVILTSSEVRETLTDLVRGALSV